MMPEKVSAMGSVETNDSLPSDDFVAHRPYRPWPVPKPFGSAQTWAKTWESMGH